MHQLVILTALTATSGLFGGGGRCRHGRLRASDDELPRRPACLRPQGICTWCRAVSRATRLPGLRGPCPGPGPGLRTGPRARPGPCGTAGPAGPAGGRLLLPVVLLFRRTARRAVVPRRQLLPSLSPPSRALGSARCVADATASAWKRRSDPAIPDRAPLPTARGFRSVRVRIDARRTASIRLPRPVGRRGPRSIGQGPMVAKVESLAVGSSFRSVAISQTAW